jgi:phospholipid/cholesterol/gamma-HCH transport system substrate-binding protein
MGSFSNGRLHRAFGVLAAGLIASVGLSGCLVSSPSTITTTAYFQDVGNLVAGAPVEMAGITVGGVNSITLRGARARVVMSIDKSAHVPANVSAKVEQSTVLGQEVVQLTAPKATFSSRLLSDRSVIRRTSLVPGIQQFVAGGTAVLGSIGTSQLASLINASGQGFGGQGRQLRQLIAHLDTMMRGYSSRDGEIKTLVHSMDTLSSSLAPKAAANAEALSNLSRTIGVLNRQSSRFMSLLAGLDHLSVQGHSLLTEELSQIDFQFRGLAGVTGTLNGQQRALAQFLEQLPNHNATLHDVTVNRFSQIIDSLIICGLPDGGSSSQAASSCHGAGGSVTKAGRLP